MTSSVLLYNLFPVHHWRSLTATLLQYCQHDDVFIHVSLPVLKAVPWEIHRIKKYLLRYTDEQRIFFSLNSRKKGESQGFEEFRKRIDFANYSIATYIHSKGVSKRKWRSQNVYDWTMLMKYFVVDRMDLCRHAFSEGYKLYGCLLLNKEQMALNNEQAFCQSSFHYSGNFVSVNLDTLRQEFLAESLVPDFFGVESFWGRLCDVRDAYNAHTTGIKNHYDEPYPEINYKNTTVPLVKRRLNND